MAGSLVNYTECVELVKEKDEKGKDVVCGAKIKDRITGKYRDFLNLFSLDRRPMILGV